MYLFLKKTCCLPETRAFILKDQNFWGFQLSRVYCFSLKFAYKKRVKKIAFFLNKQILETKTKTKQKITHTGFQALLRKHMRKISGENIKPYFSWSSWKSSFFKQKTLVFCKEQVFVQNHLPVFFSAVLGKLASGRLPPTLKLTQILSLAQGGICWGQSSGEQFYGGQFSGHPSAQNQYNQTITKFALKSNFQDIHKP